MKNLLLILTLGVFMLLASSTFALADSPLVSFEDKKAQKVELVQPDIKISTAQEDVDIIIIIIEWPDGSIDIYIIYD